MTRNYLPPALSPRALRTAAPVLVSATIAVIGIAFLLGRPPDTSRPREGGIWREAVIGSLGPVHPLVAGDHGPLSTLLFAGLTRPGPDGAPESWLAETWDVTDDARSFTFTLRRAAFWHDGTPVTAADVVFTIHTLNAMGDRADPRLRTVWGAAQVEAIGTRAVRVTLPDAFAPLPAYAGFGLLPAHLLKVEEAAQPEHPFFQAPVGNGPFRFVRLQSTEAAASSSSSPSATGAAPTAPRPLVISTATLARFDRFVMGVPWLDQIELRAYPDATAVAESVSRGTANGAVLPGTHTDRAGSIGYAYTVVLLNQRNPVFQDARVRTALSHALDRAAIATTAGGRPSDVPLPPGSWVQPAPFTAQADAGEAAKLLAAAGWSPSPAGVLTRQGRPFALTLVCPDDPRLIRIADAVATAWGALGTRITLAPAALTTLTRDFLIPRAYDMALVGWDPGLDPDPFTAWHSSLAGRPAGNYADVRDTDLDAAIVAQRRALTLDSRRDALQRFGARFREAMPGVVILYEGAQVATRGPATRGVPSVLAAPADIMYDAPHWYLGTRK